MASGPTPPNANDLSKAQTQSNIQTATAQTGLNAMNQYGPGGSSTYKQVGTWPDGTPRFSQTTSLSPALQGVFDTGIQTQQQIGNAARGLSQNLNLNPINAPQYQQYGGGPNLATGAQGGNIQSNIGPSDYAGQRQGVEDALLGRVNQSYDRDRASLEQRLANQGIQQGTEAYTNAMSDHNRGLADARTSAVLGAGQEQNRLQQLALNSGQFANQAQAQQFGQNFSNAGLGNTAQQQMFQNNQQTTGLNNQLKDQSFGNAITGNNQNINQLLALLGGGQINSQPQFGQTPQTGVAGTDVAGNAWNQFNAQQGQSNQMWNGLGALGGTLGGFLFSDRRLKADIRDTGERTPQGIPVKNWRYKGSPMMQTGFIAQDVAKRQPEAVRKGPGGFLMVAPSMVR